jgi:hypothetical protein
MRLEQARAVRPSEGVLEALGRALRLDPAERVHLRDLARPEAHEPLPPATEQVRPDRLRLLELLEATPAAIQGRLGNILVWNDLIAALVADFGAMAPRERNMPRLLFLDDDVRRRFHTGWESAARASVSYLRLYAGRHPDDPQLVALVGELSVRSPEFRALWSEHEVALRRHGEMTFRHPLVGDVTLHFDALNLPVGHEVLPEEDVGQTLVVYTAAHGSRAARALAQLAHEWQESRQPGPGGPTVGAGPSASGNAPT